MKKVNHDTGRSRMEEEHVVALAVDSLISRASDGTCCDPLT